MLNQAESQASLVIAAVRSREANNRVEFTMTRMPPLNPPYPEAIQAQFDAIMPPGVPPLMLFRTLAGHERAWKKFRAAALLDGGPLSLRQREIVIDRTCARARCNNELLIHISLFADKAGLTAEQISAISEVHQRPDLWSPAEEVMIAAVDALHDRAGLNEEEYEHLREHFQDDQILEIFMLAGFYRMVAYIVNSLDFPIEEIPKS